MTAPFPYFRRCFNDSQTVKLLNHRKVVKCEYFRLRRDKISLTEVF